MSHTVDQGSYRCRKRLSIEDQGGGGARGKQSISEQEEERPNNVRVKMKGGGEVNISHQIEKKRACSGEACERTPGPD